jgi:hypothetical protein
MAVSWRGLAGIPVGVCHDSVPWAIAQTSRHAIPEVQNQVPGNAARVLYLVIELMTTLNGIEVPGRSG